MTKQALLSVDALALRPSRGAPRMKFLMPWSHFGLVASKPWSRFNLNSRLCSSLKVYCKRLLTGSVVLTSAVTGTRNVGSVRVPETRLNFF